MEVDPVDLHMSADHMDMHHSDFTSAHGAANADIEAAQSGWVGTSGAALQAMFSEWQEATQSITRDIASHGAAFRTAAHRFATVDDDAAEHLDDQL